ncbi:hypothetical protein B0H63DRAFT_481825 [Podospora didyma]|uniref:Uncharacterized protein n=1 Tax=Podospora didyma TaxID=330526 RepID=A0AAE0N9D8_9PEZI|nr:hypothetical protein B0H63DRAFT_481825 [Podospora didyma]
MGHHTSTANFQAADFVDQDEVMSDDGLALQPSSAKASGKGKGRGRWTRSKTNKIVKPVPAKPALGRGRRHKIYDSYKAQAAHERCQELKAAFSTLFKMVKPVVQDIADRSIAEITDDPSVVEKAPEFVAVHNFLQNRLDDAVRKARSEREIGLAMAQRVYDAQLIAVHESYKERLANQCEDRYAQLILELETLEHLHNNNLPVDLPAGPRELVGEYLYKDITQEQANSQSQYVEMRNGIEVPFHGKMISELMTMDAQLSPTTPAPKRKAEGQPEGQPSAKIAATAKDDEAISEMPRHTGGLLAAVEALEDSNGTPSASNAPTPNGEPAASPEPADQARASGDVTPKDSQEIPIPRGAGPVDEYGVRIISKRPSRMDIPNNRIMVPNAFEFDNEDIGFRDSTNCTLKGAIKSKRGKYLNKPGSNFMFLDRRVGVWDSTKAEGELDQELVKKHGLHPTLGLFLPTSVNLPEPPKAYVFGWNPVVLVTPNGEEIHASRTIQAARLDRKIEQLEKKAQIKEILRTVCEEEGIAQEEIAPSQEEKEEHRKQILAARNIKPEEVRVKSSPQETPETSREASAAFGMFVSGIIEAASTQEAGEEAARIASARRPPPSRPYDPIRNVFTDNASALQPPTASQDAPSVADANNLLWLANAAENHEQVPSLPEASVMDHFPPGQSTPNVTRKSPRETDFLRTALNPQPRDQAAPTGAQDFPRSPAGAQEYDNSPAGAQEYAGIPGGAQDYLGGTVGLVSGQESGAAAGRTPFLNNGAAKGLPALRPVRSLLNDSPPLPEPHGSPAPQHIGMVVTNSGTFFPPAPTRAFHNAFSVPDQGPGLPLQPFMPQPLGAALQGQHVQQPRQLSPYSLSPPPYHNLPSAPVLAPAIGAAPPPSLEVGVPQTPIASAQPAVSSPRSRPGSSSASSSKYRKLEPAPTPPHRQGYSASGQELRTVQFNYREAIKDYTPVEAPPQHGPTHIRGWAHNNLKKPRSSSKSDAPGEEQP